VSNSENQAARGTLQKAKAPSQDPVLVYISSLADAEQLAYAFLNRIAAFRSRLSGADRQALVNNGLRAFMVFFEFFIYNLYFKNSKMIKMLEKFLKIK
jgi:hypothetical protein